MITCQMCEMYRELQKQTRIGTNLVLSHAHLIFLNMNMFFSPEGVLCVSKIYD